MFTTRLGAAALNRAVVHQHDRLRASVVAAAVTRPIAGLCWRHLQLERLALRGTWRLGHDHRLRVDPADLRDGLANAHPPLTPGWLMLIETLAAMADFAAQTPIARKPESQKADGTTALMSHGF